MPAVVAAAQDLFGTVPPPRPSCPPSSAGPTARSRWAFSELGEEADDLDFAARFDRLPDAEARLLGRTLGAIQTQLSPTEVDGVAR